MSEGIKVSSFPPSVTGFVVTVSQIKVSVITALICMTAETVMCAHAKPVQDY